jgi:hypothetical protein
MTTFHSDVNMDHQDWIAANEGMTAMDDAEYQQMLDAMEQAYWEMRATYYEERESQF